MAKKRKSPSPSEETVDDLTVYPTPLPSEDTASDGPQEKNARPSCSIDGCKNNAAGAGGGICRKHGGKEIKKKCSVEGCEHRSRNNGVCCRHGSKQIRRKCSVGGCDKQSWKRGVCYKHQSMANLVPQKKNARPSCSVDGCSHNAAEGGICRKHGEKQIFKRCSVDGCDRRAWRGGVCLLCYKHRSMVLALGGGTEDDTTCYESESKRTHSSENQVCKNQTTVSSANLDSEDEEELGAFIYKSSRTAKMRAEANSASCSVDGCNNNAAGGRTCINHGGKRIKNKCSDERCTNQAQKGGACMSHGGIKKKCSVDGCSSYASRLGFCWRHAPKEQCSFEGCDNITIARGCCRKHANSNIHSKESNNFSTNDADSDHQPQNGEQEGPLVCLPAVKRVNKKSNHCVTQDQAALNFMKWWG